MALLGGHGLTNFEQQRPNFVRVARGIDVREARQEFIPLVRFLQRAEAPERAGEHQAPALPSCTRRVDEGLHAAHQQLLGGASQSLPRFVCGLVQGETRLPHGAEPQSSRLGLQILSVQRLRQQKAAPARGPSPAAGEGAACRCDGGLVEVRRQTPWPPDARQGRQCCRNASAPRDLWQSPKRCKRSYGQATLLKGARMEQVALESVATPQEPRQAHGDLPDHHVQVVFGNRLAGAHQALESSNQLLKHHVRLFAGTQDIATKPQYGPHRNDGFAVAVALAQ
mmetsp:Transcript_91145/g.260776  ORF Transcript_91145/g.260776 Transcript_91145/m.260776 type:complete len:282 (-) Transcript_91145:759-1604(-)